MDNMTNSSDTEMHSGPPTSKKMKKLHHPHYMPIHIVFTPEQLERSKANRPCHIPVENLHEDSSKGGRLTYLSTAQALSAQRALKNGKQFKYHPSLADIKFNCEHELAAGSWGDFTSWVSDRWEDVKEVGRTILHYAPAILDFVAEILPAGSPQLLALKAALKVASGVAAKLDQLVNKTAQAKDVAEHAETEYETSKSEAEDAVLDFKLSAKDKSASDKEKAKLKKLAEEAKARVEKKRAELKRKEAEAKALEKEAREVQKKKKEAEAHLDKKAKEAEAAAKKLQKKQKK